MALAILPLLLALAAAEDCASCTSASLFLQQHRRIRRELLSECAAAGQNCRSSGCCEDVGHTCYEKNEYWASCLETCEPGAANPNDAPEYRTPWTCAVIGQPPISPPVDAAGFFVASTAGSSKARLYEFLNVLSDQPVPNSRARAVHSSGGAAGGVVSESQGYGLLLTGALLASMEVNDSEYQKVLDYTYEMFLGWKRMCMLSKDGSCQEDEGFQCGGGQYPCLPHWKFDDDLTGIIGKGAAPDGDADALAGMLLSVMALERKGGPANFLAEVGQWTYDTCKQFYLSSTVSSSSGRHRIVKLGSCWGGWGGQGQNPSYHAPGIYRLCRNYMKSHDSKYGTSSSEGDGYEADWNRLIETTYKMFDATQCDSSGLIPNRAKVYEQGQSLRAETGFSGSGTPGAEFGAEASRAVWRVALDYLLFPEEAKEAARFLNPVATHLETRESNGNWAENLRVDGNCLVESIHPGWSFNMFMAGPTFTSLVCPSSLDATRQQTLIDAAGARVASKAINDYYSGSWVAISTITLNGDLLRAAKGAGLTGTPATTVASGTTTATTTVACFSELENCQATGCCVAPGKRCYEKNEHWASCRESCQPGEVNVKDPLEYRTPWSCRDLSAGWIALKD